MTDATYESTAQPATAAGAEVDKGVDKVSQAASQFAEKASATASQLSDKASATASQISKVVGERANVAKDWAADQTDVLRDTVQTRPFVSAASAFAAGLVLGILLTK